MLIVVSFIDYKFITKFYILGYIANIGLLLLVLLIGDKTTGGATRQLGIGGFSIQPSEFAKLFMLIFLSKFLDKYNERINHPLLLIILAVLIIIPVYLVKEQPSLSASLVILSLSVVLVFMAGISYKYIAGVLAIGMPLGFIVIQDILRPDPIFIDKILRGYQLRDRIIPYIKPELASSDLLYQTQQSMKAIGSGQLTGQGLYNGTVHVPKNHNDFIFSVLGEEFGFVGCMVVITIMLIIIIKCLYTAYKAEDMTGRLFAAGVGFMFAFQTFVNIGVAIGILPNTGMSLPFMSSGGSAMWVNMILVGMVINIGIEKPKSFFEE